MKHKINITFSLLSRIFIFGALLMGSINANATHIIGGGITYKKVSTGMPGDSDLYEITLSIRRDKCNGTEDFDKPAVIGIFGSNGNLIKQLNMTFSSSGDVTQYIESNCEVEGQLICVEQTRYIERIHLPYRNGGYLLVYQRCCRNMTVQNIEDPLETGATFYVQISEEALQSKNSSPEFKNWPDIYVCANKPIIFDNSAIDIDGDSLVYKLCVPKIGGTITHPRPQPPAAPPYEDVIWKDPYNLDNLMGGVPLKYNSATGLLTGTPNVIGQFVVGLCVEEYRNGVLLSTINRDFQYNVVNCSLPPKADFTAPLFNCNTLTVPFTNTSVSTVDFTWYFNYPDTSAQWVSHEKDPIFTFPAAGVYTVKLVATRFTDKCRDSLIRQISVTDIPYVADFTSKIASCNPDGSIDVFLADASHTATPGITSTDWQWIVTQNNASNTYSGNPITVNLEAGDFTVDLHVTSSNGCEGDTTKLVPLSTIDLDANFNLFFNECTSPDSLTIILDDISDQLNPNYTISSSVWLITTPTGVYTATGSSPAVTIPRTSFTVKLTTHADNGCSSEISKDFQVTDFIPIVDFGYALMGCDDNNTAIIKYKELTADTTTYANIASFNWDIGGTLLQGDSVQLAAQAGDTVIAKLTVVLNNGCEATLSKQLVIDNIRPQIGYIYNAIGCENDETVNVSLSFDSTAINGYTHGPINWVVGVASNLQSLTGTNINITIPKDSILNVMVSTTFDNGCSDTVTASFLPGPFATIDLVSDTIVLCPNEPAHLINDGNPAFTYTYSTTEGLDLTKPYDPIVTINHDITYIITVSDGLCTVSAPIFVDILESIPLFISGNDYTCLGDVSLTVSGGVGVGDYEWSTNANFNPIIFVGDTLNTTFQGPEKTYYVRFKGEICFSESANITVVNQTPEIEYASPFSLCSGDTITYQLFNAVPDHVLSVIWESNPHILSGGNSLMPVIGVGLDDSLNFDLVFTVTNQYNCAYTDTLKIVIDERPKPDFTYVVQDCKNYTVCFDIIGDFNGFPNWDFGDPTTTDDKSLIKTVCYTYPGPGTYTVTLQNVSSICPFNTIVKEITLNESLELITLDDDEACVGSVYNLPVPQGANGLEYKWCDLAGNELGINDPLPIAVEGDRTVVLKVKDENNCPFADTFTVKAFEFNYILNLPDVFCKGQETSPSISVEGGLDYIYDWQPAECVISGGNTANPILFIDKKKTITVTVTHPTLGCILTKSFDVTPTSLDISVEASPDAEIYLGQSVDIFVVDPATDYTYLWDNPGPITTSTQTVSPEETTIYTVTVTDGQGCTGTASVEIKVVPLKCSDDVYLPNAFSPNGDGNNDILYVRANNVVDMELIIYNRWGEAIFTSKDQNVGWDGTYKGATLNSDVYAFYLKATCGNGEQIVRQGNISLLK